LNSKKKYIIIGISVFVIAVGTTLWLWWLNTLVIVVQDKYTKKPIQTIRMKILYKVDKTWKEKIITIWNNGRGEFHDKLILNPEVFIVPSYVGGYKPVVIHSKIQWYQKTLYIYCEQVKKYGIIRGEIINLKNRPLNKVPLSIQFKYPMNTFLEKINKKGKFIFAKDKMDKYDCATSLKTYTNPKGEFEFKVPIGTWYFLGIPEISPISISENQMINIGKIKITNIEQLYRYISDDISINYRGKILDLKKVKQSMKQIRIIKEDENKKNPSGACPEWHLLKGIKSIFLIWSISMTIDNHFTSRFGH